MPQFVNRSSHPTIQTFKLEYMQNIASAMGETWDEYWIRMAQDKIEVDHKFIQATAWLIGCDMLIVDTSCKMENPYIHISGNIDIENHGCKELIFLGSKSNCHYQSLLKTEVSTDEKLTIEQGAEEVIKYPSKILNPKETNKKK